MKDTKNDHVLSEQVSKILRCQNDINRCLRDNNLPELWKHLATVGNAVELASYRILDLSGGV